MHLRSLWFRAVSQNGLIKPQEMYVYTLASFLLQLSLLDLPCCAYAPSHLAAAALSLAMTAFNKPAWPRALESYGSYTLEVLDPLRRKLAAIQGALTASQLRRCWKITYIAPDENHPNAWKKAVAVFNCPSSILMDILDKQPDAAAVAVAMEEAVPLPAVPVATQLESQDEEEVKEAIEIDDDTSSASTDSVIDNDILLLASAPMSPVGESTSIEASEEIDIEGYEIATAAMSVVRASAISHGLLVSPL
jgi:hypothetical protein